MLDLRIFEDFSDRVDRRIGNMIGVEPQQPVIARFAPKLLAQDRDDLIVAIGAGFRCGRRGGS